MNSVKKSVGLVLCVAAVLAMPVAVAQGLVFRQSVPGLRAATPPPPSLPPASLQWNQAGPVFIGHTPSGIPLVYTLTLQNAPGTQAANISGISLTQNLSGFSLKPSGSTCNLSGAFSLAGGSSCTVQAELSWSGLGSQQATIRASQAGGSDKDVALSAFTVGFNYTNPHATYSNALKTVSWAAGANDTNGVSLNRTVASGSYYLEYTESVATSLGAPEFCFSLGPGQFFCYRPYFGGDFVGSSNVLIGVGATPKPWQPGDVIGLLIYANPGNGSTLYFLRRRAGVCTVLASGWTTSTQVGSYLWRSPGLQSYASQVTVNLGQSSWACPPASGVLGFGY